MFFRTVLRQIDAKLGAIMSAQDDLKAAITKLTNSVSNAVAQIKAELENLNTDDPDTEAAANKISELADTMDSEVQAAQATIATRGGSGSGSTGGGAAPPPASPAGTPPGA